MTDLYKQFAEAVGGKYDGRDFIEIGNKGYKCKNYETIWELAVEFLEKKLPGFYSIEEEYCSELKDFQCALYCNTGYHCVYDGKTKSEALMRCMIELAGRV